MKTLLVPTDFSQTANNAASYALQLAQVLKADIKLCNAIKVPAESFLADTVVWPLEDYASLKENVTCDLKIAITRLQQELQESIGDHAFSRIDFTSEVGSVADIVKNMVGAQRIPLVVMGMSGAGALSKLFLGSNSFDLIEKADFPLLLIPADLKYKVIKKIAFATDFNPHDVGIICSLVTFARNFNAEIMIAHIADEKYHSAEHEKVAQNFLSDITSNANYDKIYYRLVKNIDVAHGLDWICQHSFSDMIIISHGKHNILDAFFNGSNAKKLARHVNIPLMVYPKEVRSSALIAF
ncbi:universal stress protein [Mucilaginibacter calamicampi]|uniref:Universal stress protein n=1 Tax=Mucilaginibacter calamicampi TaxID=1302352 RepID=A0ABW2YW27_9SPHI